MPGYSGITYGNVSNTFVVTTGPISPTIVNTITTSVQTFPIPGLLTTDQISTVSKPTFQTGLMVLGALCLTNGVISIQFGNPTAAGITPTAGETYTIEVNRTVNPPSLPVSIV